MPDFPDRPAYSFSPGPPPEASRFLANKGLKPAFSWEDVEPEEHAVAFSVAKAMDTQVLEAIRDEVQAAIDEGLTFQQFKKRLRPQLEAKGWWGRKEVVDPDTGEVVEAQLGSPRRLRTIYRANLRSARAAGQWQRIERTADAMPYLEYRLGPSERHRPHHVEKEGLVLPWDDPFWSRWYPPNGWGCKCWVRQLTQRQAEQRGISESPEVPTVEVVNRRTGEIRRVPVGIDPGWDRNPGQLRAKAMEDFLVTELEAADSDVARVVTRDIATSWRAERVLKGTAGGSVPVAVLPADVAAQVNAGTRIVRMTGEYGDKLEARARGVTVAEMARLDAALAEGTVVLERSAGGTSLVAVSPGAKPWKFAIKVLAEKSELWINTIHRIERRHARALKRRQGVTIVRE